MYRILSIAIPLALMLSGIFLSIFLRYCFLISKLNIFYSIGIGLFFALLEVQLLKKIDKNKLRYSLMDGAIFPFISVGVAVGMFLG
jgi:hypothetical protein